jgi:hypothetical protein
MLEGFSRRQRLYINWNNPSAIGAQAQSPTHLTNFSPGFDL